MSDLFSSPLYREHAKIVYFDIQHKRQLLKANEEDKTSAIEDSFTYG